PPLSVLLYSSLIASSLLHRDLHSFPTRRSSDLFSRGPLQMIGWLVALVYNAVADFAAALDGDYEGCHVSTLQRKFFNRSGRLYRDRKSTRLNSSHVSISYAVFCLKKKNKIMIILSYVQSFHSYLICFCPFGIA